MNQNIGISLYYNVKNFAERKITLKTSKVICIYFAAISILELLAYKKEGIYSIIASRIWFFTGLLCFTAFILQCIENLIYDIKSKNFYIIIGILAAVFIFYSFIGNLYFSDINPDAAQQLAAGLNSFEKHDLNYTKTAFLGYPNRQYVIAAVFAAIFGRNIYTLHLGFGYLFLIGILELFFEVRKWLKNNNQNETLALIPIYSFFGFRFITEYFINFEQAITPVALTMLGIALFLKIYRKPDLIGILSIAWIGCFFCNSYTPIIASLGLLLVFILLYIGRTYFKIKKETNKEINDKKNLYALLITLTAVFFNICLFFAATLIADRKDRLSYVREDISPISFIFTCIEEFFTDKNAVFLGIFALIVILYMVLALFLRLKPYDFLLACWVLGVIVFANYMVGYTSYSKAWIMQRNMIIIPVLIIGIFFSIMNFLKTHKISINKFFLSGFIVFLTCIGIYNFSRPHQSFTYFSYIKPIKYMFKYAEDLCNKNNLKCTDEINLVLYTDNAFQTNLHDYALFLYPNAHTYVLSENIIPDEINLSLPTIIFSENTDFSNLYSGTLIYKDFKDIRYNCKHIWYAKIVN